MREKAGELLELVPRLARIIKGHLEGTLTHLTRGMPTASMGKLNSQLSAVKPKARGYRTVEYMTAMLYFAAGKLTLSCHLPT
jgi:hypothetical protein